MSALRRRGYLQHVLPPGQHRVRYFGWMHPAAKKRRAQVETLLAVPLVVRTKAEEPAWHLPFDSAQGLELIETALPALRGFRARARRLPPSPRLRRAGAPASGAGSAQLPPMTPSKPSNRAVRRGFLGEPDSHRFARVSPHAWQREEVIPKNTSSRADNLTHRLRCSPKRRHQIGLAFTAPPPAQTQSA